MEKPECPLEQEDVVVGACATNIGILVLSIRHETENKVPFTIVDRFRGLVTKHPQYFDDMRRFQNLSVEDGWLDKHIEDATCRASKGVGLEGLLTKPNEP